MAAITICSDFGAPQNSLTSPITSWQIEGENVEVVTDFLFLGSKITVNGDCSCKIRRQLLLSRKIMTNLCVEKQTHYSVDKGL